MALLLYLTLPAYGQQDTTVLKPVKQDTLPKPVAPVATSTQKTSMFKGHSPKLATLMSAVVPGLGQAYNRKYWKIPIIYGGIGVCYYFFKDYDNYFRDFKNAYIAETDTDHTTINPYPNLREQQLKVYITDARRYRDLNAFLMVLVYALNVVDACVDAHLYKFDVGDDLSLKFQPRIDYMPLVNRKPMSGLSLTLTFK
jgi:hypothetical protein